MKTKRNRVTSSRANIVVLFLGAMAFAILANPKSANGQVIAGIAKSRIVPETVQVINMEITPSKEPVPAFKYRLTVLPHKTIVGNAATHYLRSFGEHSLESPLKAAEKKFGFEEFNNVWLDEETSIESLPLDKVREASAMFDHYIQNHIDRASRCRECDWGLGENDLTGKQVFDFLLPSVQQTRQISRVLALQTRLAVADKRFDDAVELMRMNFQLGQDISKINNLVCGLIGVSHVSLSSRGMRDFVAAPGSPNMYWALTELPRPIIDIRDALRLESQTGIRILTQLKDVETAKHTPEEWSRLARQAAETFNRIQSEMYSNRTWDYDEQRTSIELWTTAFGVMSYGPAKSRLVEGGYPKEVVEAMAVGQVLLIDAAREYQKQASQLEKAIYVSLPKARQINQTIESKWRNKALNSPGRILAGMLAPPALQVMQSLARTQREIEVLRLIEAIRLHAAETGKLPASLGEIKVVPVPKNPMTDNPFEYRINGDAAMIDLPKSDGVWRPIRYVLRLK